MGGFVQCDVSPCTTLFNLIPFHLPSPSTIQGMMALAGFAYSALVCSTFSRAQKQVIEMGFLDDINTYVMISGAVSKLFIRMIISFCSMFKQSYGLSLYLLTFGVTARRKSLKFSLSILQESGSRPLPWATLWAPPWPA